MGAGERGAVGVGGGGGGGLVDVTCNRTFVGTEGGEWVSLLGLGELFLRGSGEGGGSDPHMRAWMGPSCAGTLSK